MRRPRIAKPRSPRCARILPVLPALTESGLTMASVISMATRPPSENHRPAWPLGEQLASSPLPGQEPHPTQRSPLRRPPLERLRQRLAEIGRRLGDLDTRRAQRRHLLGGAALAAGDDGAGVSHAAARRRRATGDETD